MNKLDILPQNAARRTEAQTGKAPGASPDGGDEGKTRSHDGAFGSLLKALKRETTEGRPAGALAALEQADSNVASSIETLFQAGRDARDDDTDKPAETLEDLLRALSSKGESGQGQATPTGGEAGQIGATLAALEKLLPKLFVQGSPKGAQEQQAQAAQNSSMPTNVLAAADPASKGGLKIAVLHQETHFKPIIEGLTAQLSSQEDGGARLGGASEIALSPAAGASKAVDGRIPPVGLSATLQAGASGPSNAAGSHDMDPSVDRVVAKDGAVQAAAAPQPEAAAPQSDMPASLPTAMLQRIGAAIVAEAGSLSAEFATTLQGAETAAPRTTVKASEGAVRILNIQLHPADLGAVTVRMRLSGEHLEMQLHASNEETARLLKSDSEKLSALLRSAGYRPDVVSVHTGAADATSINNASPARSHAFGQAPQNGSPQGGSGQQGHAAHQDRRREAGRKDVQGDGQVEDRSLARSLGGIYL